MFKRPNQPTPPPVVQTVERITSVLGAGVIWQGNITGSGGVRVEGTFEGQIALKGLLLFPFPVEADADPDASEGKCGRFSMNKTEHPRAGKRPPP